MQIKYNVSPATRNNWLLDSGLFLSGLITFLSGIYFLFIPKGGFMGGNNPWYNVIIIFNRDTWDWLHNWIGLAMVVIALLHFILHWKWVVRMTKQVFNRIHGRAARMNPWASYNLWLNIVTGLSGFVSGATGVYLLLIGGSEGGRNPDPMFLFSRDTWNVLHDWGSVVFLIAVILHLAIHWGWIKKVTRKLFTGRSTAQAEVVIEDSMYGRPKKRVMGVLGVVLLAAFAGLLVFGAVNRTFVSTESTSGETGEYEKGTGHGQGQGGGKP